MIGNKLGTVVSVTGNGELKAWFQLYQVNAIKGGPFMLIREDEFENEYEANDLFKAWVVEAALLVEVGDM